MTWAALTLRESHEQVRPAGRFTGQFIAAVAASGVFAVAASVGMGFFLRAVSEGLPFTSVHPHILLALVAGCVAASFMAVLVPMNLGVDAVAGERERHTLPTLIATPLTDAQIVWAKAAAVTLVSMAAAAVAGVLVWATLVVLYGAWALLWGLLAPVVAALLTSVPAFGMACLAMGLSTRAKTVRDAGQRLALAIMPLFLLFPLTSVLGAAQSPVAVVVGSVAVPALIITYMVVGPGLAFARFRREKLLTV